MMTKKHKLIFLIAILQIAILAILYISESIRIKNEKSRIITVEADSITISDNLNYILLNINYKMGKLKNFKDHEKYVSTSSDIYVVLKEQGDLFVPDYVSNKKPKINSNQLILLGAYYGGHYIFYPYIDSIDKEKSKVKFTYKSSPNDKIRVQFSVYRGSQRSKTVFINGKNIEHYFQPNN